MVELHGMRASWAKRSRLAPKGWAPRRLPGWARLRPTLVRAHAAWPTLYEVGQLVFGTVLIGDPRLFKPGTTCASARLAWSADPQLLARPALLEEVRARFLHIRQHGSEVPGLRRYARLAQDNDHHPQRRRMPAMMSGSVVVFEQEVMVDPQHLPGQRIAHPSVPLVVDPGGVVPGAFILHRRMWSPRMRETW